MRFVTERLTHPMRCELAEMQREAAGYYSRSVACLVEGQMCLRSASYLFDTVRLPYKGEVVYCMRGLGALATGEDQE